MTNLPDDFLPTSDLRYYYEHRKGTHGDYQWLESMHLELLDFFKWVPPPAGGFMVIVTSFDGANGGGPFLTIPEWEELSSFAMSPILQFWPIIVPTGNGESVLVFDADADMVRVMRGLSEFEDVGYREQFDDLSLASMVKF